VVEADYWASLEYRVCREFAGMPEDHLSSLWCDGVIPSKYLLHEATPRITGTAWICNGPRQDEWEFTLLLPHAVGSRDEIAWATLLPPENVTRWLGLDHQAFGSGSRCRSGCAPTQATGQPDPGVAPIAFDGAGRNAGWVQGLRSGYHLRNSASTRYPSFQTLPGTTNIASSLGP
jgi:hypothetical protein